jgi:hypothetical protein
LDRLTDLLVDGTLSNTDYQTRKQNTEFELAQFHEEEKRYADNEKNVDDLGTLLKRACDLARLFANATTAERRALLKNCTEEIVVRKGIVRLRPASWLKEMKLMVKDDQYRPSADILGIGEPAKTKAKKLR